MGKKILFVVMICVLFAAVLTACDTDAAVVGLTLVSAPQKTVYAEGEIFDATGMEIRIDMSDGSSVLADDYDYAPADGLTVDDTAVTVMCEIDGKIFSVRVPVTVRSDSLMFPAPLSVVIDGSRLSWEEVDGADGYEIYIDGALIGYTPELFYDFDLPDGAHTVQVAAVSGDTSGEKSEELIYIAAESELVAPYVWLDANTAFWQPVANADGYEIFVNGEKVCETCDTIFVFDYHDVGVYDISVRAFSEEEERIFGDFSASARYVVSVDLMQPVNLVAPNGSSVKEGEEGYLATDCDFVNDGDAFLLEDIGNREFFIRRTDGTYLVYADGSGVMEERGYVFSDVLDKTDPAFRWKLFAVAGTADQFIVSTAAESSECCLAFIDGNIGVCEVSSANLSLGNYVFTLKQADVDTSDFADGKEYENVPFNFGKPFAMRFRSLASENYWLGVKNGFSGQEAELSNFLSEKTRFMKYAPMSAVGNSVFAFEPATDYSASIPYNPDGAVLYRIRTYDGRYLGITKGNYIVGGGAADYVSATEFNEEDMSQIWSVIEVSDGVIMLQNISYNYDWDVLGRNGQLNVYLCNLNADRGQTGMYTFNKDNKAYFEIELFNVEADMQSVRYDTKDGDSASVSYLGHTDRFLSISDGNILSVSSEETEFTFESAGMADEPHAYFIRTQDGKYLTYTDWYLIGALDKKEDASSQIFLLLPVCGVKNGYTLCPYVTGTDIDPVDGHARHRNLFVNDEAINHAQLTGDDFMRVYSEYGRVEYRNYFQRIWLINFSD